MAAAAGTRPDADLGAALSKRRFKRVGESVIKLTLVAAASVSLFTTIAIVTVLVWESIPFFQEVPVQDFLFKTDWQPLFRPVSFGVWELIAGTMNIVFWSLLMALPVGLAAAIYLSEYADPRVRRILKPLLEALASVPTVVYAYFALTFVTLDVLRPIFGDSISIFNALGASTVMAVMLIPTIASISEDSMASVPRELREGAYGLGATRLEVAFKVVLPAALSGVIASVLLAIARAVGETMIVAVAAGSTPNLTLNPLASIQTMTGYMLQVGLGDAARGSVQYRSLFAVGLSLFVITMIFNIAAQLVIKRFREEYD
ncbi:MAG: phosphate ABC transporter permease subunit PstC [Dehalococcoidia bacterium]|nr:phosphate ABC transporter permease subunit PstC [Dehalococcoidia bacterium]